MHPPEEESALVAAAVAGDGDALTRLLLAHGPQVRAQLSGAIDVAWRSVLDIEDVMQVTYLEAFVRIGSYDDRGAGSFFRWLLQIARNNLYDAVRELSTQKRSPREARLVPLQPTESASALLDAVLQTTTTASRCAAAAEVEAVVNEAVAQLPADYAAVVRMYDLGGQDASEVGRHMGRSEGAVYMLRSRALDRLREILCARLGISQRA